MIGFSMLGIIGFLNILREAKKDTEVTVKGNYIEFDTNLLKNFSEDYFYYFLKKYDIANRLDEIITKNCQRIEGLLLSKIEEPKTKEEKEKNKKIQEKIKEILKYTKDSISNQKKKIQKFNETSYQKIEDEYKKIKEPKAKEDLENLIHILNNIKNEIAKEENNKRITLNYFKSILSNNYFGQISFLNIVKNASTMQEQMELMKKQYISNIIESSFLQEILDKKYEIKDIELHIKDAKNLTEDAEKIYKQIQKMIEKNKTLQDIEEYIKAKLNNCYLCEEKLAITENYTEGNFIPLAVSSENMTNFFWNQKPQVPICPLCKLMLFCTPAGITSITKVEKDGNKYRESEIYSFINYDTSVNKLLQVNRNFADNSKKERNLKNPYVDSILDIVNQEKEISKWQLQNVFVVEFETKYTAYGRIKYFHIRPNVAAFLSKHAKILQTVNDYSFRLQITDMMLKNEDISIIINNRLREAFNSSNSNQAFNCFMATKIREYLRLYKKEGENMEEEINKNNKKIYALYSIGQEIRKDLKKNNEENKLDSYVYKMINSIKANNKKEFLDIIIRLHLFMEKDVSPIFLEVMQDGNLDFATIGHSFLAGLISNEYQKPEKIEEV